MLIQLNFKSGLPVYLQIVGQIKAAAASGALRTGDPLPSIRELAEELRVNRNTIAKAYAELEHEGLVENQQGRGCFLVNGASPLRKSERASRLIPDIDALLVQAHHLQISPNDLRDLIESRLSEFHSRQTNGSPVDSQEFQR